MQDGGCHPVDGCLDGDDFAGADFEFLAANVIRKDNGRTLFPGYKIRTYAGARVAFIGMTLEGTPSIVTPSGIANLDFLDEADTVNALIPQLKSKGVETVVVLIHEGGAQVAPAPYNGCEGISGPILDIVNRFDDEVDVVISGHTHQAYNCVIDDKLVTSTSSFGRIVTDVDLTLEPLHGRGRVDGGEQRHRHARRARPLPRSRNSSASTTRWRHRSRTASSAPSRPPSPGRTTPQASPPSAT